MRAPEEFDEAAVVFVDEESFEGAVGGCFVECAGGRGADDGAEACGARLHGAAEVLPGDHEEWNAVFEELARLAWERFEEAFFDSLCGFGFWFGLAESCEECGDGVVVEGVEEAGAGDGLVHGVGRPEIELNWV